MSEEQTFNKLKQTPVDEMLTLLDGIVRPPPVFMLGNTSFERRDFYHDMNFQLEKIRLLKDHGWDIDDFYIALEKRSILSIVEEYNDAIAFPKDVIDRARRVFPDVKFTQASIKLE